jgi:hypothetical protein
MNRKVSRIPIRLNLPGHKGKSGGKPQETSKEILLNNEEIKKPRGTCRTRGTRLTRQMGFRGRVEVMFGEDDPAGGYGVLSKPPLGKCSINITLYRATTEALYQFEQIG